MVFDAKETESIAFLCERQSVERNFRFDKDNKQQINVFLFMYTYVFT